MSRYSEFYLNSPARVVQLDTLEILHPNFSRVYRLVRNAAKGITVTLENGQQAFFEYYPLRIRSLEMRDATLDSGFQVDFGDLGSLLPEEIDRVRRANGFRIKPSVFYRAYRSDDLSSPILGPIRLEIRDVSSNAEGASFQAAACSVNLSRTGEFYTVARFPMLRGSV